MTEKYIFFQKVTAVEERFTPNYADGYYDENKNFHAKEQSTGWWIILDGIWAFRIGTDKPEDEEGNLTIKPGDRMKFTMEKTS